LPNPAKTSISIETEHIYGNDYKPLRPIDLPFIIKLLTGINAMIFTDFIVQPMLTPFFIVWMNAGNVNPLPLI